MTVLGEFGNGSVLLAMIEIFFLFMFIWIFIALISDLFRDHEMSGGVKFLWVLFLVCIPFLGMLIYIIVRGNGMADRAIKAQAQAQKQFDDYVRQTASTTSIPGGGQADELLKLTELKDKGAISDAEFASMKAKIVGG